MLLIDKPKTWSSFDVVNKLRWQIKNKLQVKKIKVGHAGTLDPLATGLLVLCTGKFTKKIEGLTETTKPIRARSFLGKPHRRMTWKQNTMPSFQQNILRILSLMRCANLFWANNYRRPPSFLPSKLMASAPMNLQEKGKRSSSRKTPLRFLTLAWTQAHCPNFISLLNALKELTFVRLLQTLAKLSKVEEHLSNCAVRPRGTLTLRML